jgi:hypothetical protein
LHALCIAYCVCFAIGFAGPLIYYCQRAADGHIMCGWSINRGAQTDDARYFIALWEAIRISILEFHQFPSWNPYHCGGIVLYQDPQAPFPGPILLLTFFWLPAATGIKLWVISHLVAGALGARKLVKDMGANIPEQMLAATLVTACGFCAQHFGGGHLSFTPFMFLPWILWAHRRALREPRWAVLVAGLFALSFYEGATYPIPLMLVAVAIDTVTRLPNADERRSLYLSIPILAVLFPLLAGARLLPVLAYLREHPRLVPLDDQMTIADVIEAWTARNHERDVLGHPFVWPEYGDYIGLVPVLLMVLGIAYALYRSDERTRARRLDLALLLGLIWCALGNLPGFSLYGLLHLLPIYKSLRVPSRYLYPATVALATMVVWALATSRTIAVERGFGTRTMRLFVILEIVLVVGVGADLLRVNGPYVQQGVDDPLPRRAAGSNFFHDANIDYTRFPTFPSNGVGTPQCYVPLEWGPAHGLWSGPGAQVRVEPASAGFVRAPRWSPSAIAFTAVLHAPATVLVNQNYESSWRTNVGTLHEHDGIIAVDLPAGEHQVTVQHLPKGLGIGIVLTLLGFALTALALWRLTPDRVERIYAWFAKRAAL